MKTMKAFGKEIEIGRYGLAVISEHGMVEDELVVNGAFSEVATIEKYLNWKIVEKGYMVVEFTRMPHGVYKRNVTQEWGCGNWLHAGF